MRVYGNTLNVERGEQFTLDFTLTNKDSTPYVVSNRLPNACVLISVVSNTFNASEPYMLNQWCMLNTYFKFKQTEIENKPSSAPGTWTDDESVENNTGILLEGDMEIEYYNRCVFYNTSDGKYYYYNITESKYVEYAMDIIVSFSTQITSEWASQEYTYTIAIVAGDNLSIGHDDPAEDVYKYDTRVPVLNDGKILVSNRIGG